MIDASKIVTRSCFRAFRGSAKVRVWCACHQSSSIGSSNAREHDEPVLRTRVAVTFEDLFEGPALNDYWTVAHNLTHGSYEKQLYIKDDVWVENGNLVVRTRKNRARSSNGTFYDFTSGWIEGSGKIFQQYGRFEVNASLPSASAGRAGMWPIAWPAAWLMPEPSTSKPPNVCWPVGGEIDIMEAYSHKRPGDRPRSDAGTSTRSTCPTIGPRVRGPGLRNGWYPPRNDAPRSSIGAPIRIWRRVVANEIVVRRWQATVFAQGRGSRVAVRAAVANVHDHQHRAEQMGPALDGASPSTTASTVSFVSAASDAVCKRC